MNEFCDWYKTSIIIINKYVVKIVLISTQLRIGLMVEYIDNSKVTSKREYITLFASYAEEGQGQ